MANIKVGDQTLIQKESETILQTLERNGIHPHHECRSGFCGACGCKLKSGKVITSSDAIAYTSKDHILLCCSKASTDIELEL